MFHNIYVSISIKYIKNKRFNHWTIHQILQYMIYQQNLRDIYDRVFSKPGLHKNFEIFSLQYFFNKEKK